MKAIGQGLVGRTGCNEKGEHGDEKSGEVREEMDFITAREPAMYPPMNSMVMKVKQKQQIFTSFAIAVLFSTLSLDWKSLFPKWSSMFSSLREGAT